jgi:hypothetical protein
MSHSEEKLSFLSNLSGNTIPPYDGKSDFLVWIEKLELVAALRKLVPLELIVPLFLHEGALAVYGSLAEEDKKNYPRLKKELSKAFSLNEHQALNRMISRRLETSESVDSYAADLKRLAKSVDPNGSEEYVKCFFIRGLPDRIKTQLMSASSVKPLELSEMISLARVLVATTTSASVENNPWISAVSHEKIEETSRQQKFRQECYLCRKFGHIARHCPCRYSKEERNVIKCYSCGEEGHIATHCQRRMLSKKD